jgi:mRNA interferase MazF
VRRGDIYWADLGPPAGRRPVVIVTRNTAIRVLSGVVVAPCTTTIRGIASEVLLDPDAGLGRESVVSCDNLLTVSKHRLDAEPAGTLTARQAVQLDSALKFALGIVY